MTSIKILIVGLFLSGLFGGSEIFGAAASHTTRTDSGGGVTVKVTWLDSNPSGDLRFQVVLDTHSVNIDSYDLKTISVLRDDAGNSYLPSTVENKGSGHHREATVSFAKIASGTKRFELVIKDVAQESRNESSAGMWNERPSFLGHGSGQEHDRKGESHGILTKQTGFGSFSLDCLSGCLRQEAAAADPGGTGAGSVRIRVISIELGPVILGIYNRRR